MLDQLDQYSRTPYILAPKSNLSSILGSAPTLGSMGELQYLRNEWSMNKIIITKDYYYYILLPYSACCPQHESRLAVA